MRGEGVGPPLPEKNNLQTSSYYLDKKNLTVVYYRITSNLIVFYFFYNQIMCLLIFVVNALKLIIIVLVYKDFLKPVKVNVEKF